MKNMAHSMFKTADLYEQAARILNGVFPSMGIPSTVIAALSLELYFKALYVLEFGKEFKLDGRHSHDFDALFEELPQETKQELMREFAARLAGRNMQDVRIFEQHGVTVATDLKSNLKQWSTVFKDLRYVYEFTAKSGGKQDYWVFFPEIQSVVSRAIVKREPKW